MANAPGVLRKQSFRHGILQVKLTVVWSLRESLGKLVERKPAKAVRVGRTLRMEPVRRKPNAVARGKNDLLRNQLAARN